MKKINPNKMSPQELEEYVQGLPESAPPKWSSVGWMIIMGILAIIIGVIQLNVAPTNAWVIIIGGIAALGFAGYLIYKIITFDNLGGQK